MINEELWDAIDQYVRACGGDPKTKKASAKRLVPVIEQQVRLRCRDAFEGGIAAAFNQIIPVDSYVYESACYDIDRIWNPFDRQVTDRVVNPPGKRNDK